MRLNKTEREEFRRRINILIPQMEKSDIVNLFQKEDYPRKHFKKKVTPEKLSMIL